MTTKHNNIDNPLFYIKLLYSLNTTHTQSFIITTNKNLFSTTDKYLILQFSDSKISSINSNTETEESYLDYIYDIRLPQFYTYLSDLIPKILTTPNNKYTGIYINNINLIEAYKKQYKYFKPTIIDYYFKYYYNTQKDIHLKNILDKYTKLNDTHLSQQTDILTKLFKYEGSDINYLLLQKSLITFLIILEIESKLYNTINNIISITDNISEPKLLFIQI